MNKPSIEYIAGLFDGEGYVGVASWHNGGSYLLRCTIANMDLNVLQKIEKQFGGKLRIMGFPKGNRRVCFKITWNSKECREFLEKIYPYLIIKKSQVRLALSFPLNDKRGSRTQWLIEKQREIYEELKIMKSVIPEIPKQYTDIASHEHQEMLRKKHLTIQLKKENPNLSMKEIGDKIGVSPAMICNYLRRV